MIIKHKKNERMFILFNDFDIDKTMFENHLHERYQFSLNYEGNNYKGIYHDGEISWFHPQPQHEIENTLLNSVEEEILKRIQDQFTFVNNFDIDKKMFEDHLHERYQFSLNHRGNNYKGMYHNGAISWFHPQPQNDLEDEHLNNLEEEVHERLQNHLE